MRNSWLTIVVAAGMLAGCGGGGSGSGNGSTSAQLPSGPKTYTAAKATVGDYYAYKLTYREQNSSYESAAYATRLVSNVAANGTVSIKSFSDDQVSNEPLAFASNSYSADFDALGRWLGSSNWDCGASSNPPMFLIAPLTLSVGMKWEYSGVGSSKCSTEAATQTTLANQNAAVAQEQVTVAAGTFNTIKVSRSAVEDSDRTRYTAERSCWWEPELGVEVKCVANQSSTDKTTGVKSVSSQAWELQGYSNQKLSRKADSVQRFAGNWAGRYQARVSGSDSAGDCTFIIDLAGNITGSCSGAAVYFSVTGNVSADGKLALNIANSNSAWAVAGKVDSVEQLSGTWTAPEFGSGTWIVKQY
jgi:hypothetical protein